MVVGNPLRKDFCVISRQKARSILGLKDDELLIISFGGSIGAEKLNEACTRIIKDFSMKRKNVRHIHALGVRYYSEFGDKRLKEGALGCRVVD
jgi:UDP-N-acetylglucosamine--N-acetylmuramyl-(pentapeptide) pyrophosphoryl-undecaprenol N-acetylglucosamine transferase